MKEIARYPAIGPAMGLAVGAVAQPQQVVKKLVIHVADEAEAPSELGLLPGPEVVTTDDAFTLYEKAVGSLPKDLDWEKVGDWRLTSAKELPLDDVAGVLRPFDASLALLEQAGRCRRCDWPLIVEEGMPANLRACRNMTLLLSLKARYHLGRGDYDSCVRTLGMGFALARHLSAGPNVQHLLIGAAVSSLVCREVEVYVQQPGAPSLEGAIRMIPRPLFDEERLDVHGQDPQNQSQLGFLLGRANRYVIVLQYVETLRSYARRTGRWPETLDEVKAGLPPDPVTGTPFTYRRLAETQAVLDGPVPAGGNAKDGIQYELNIVRDS